MHCLQPIGRAGAVKIFSQRISDIINQGEGVTMFTFFIYRALKKNSFVSLIVVQKVAFFKTPHKYIHIFFKFHILQKNVFFPHVRNFTLIYGPFNCLILVLFGPIFMENCVLFSNARSILELMCCNWNLTKLDILTLLSSDCRARALKIGRAFEKKTKYVFVFNLPTPTLTSFFLHFIINLKRIYFIS